MTPDTPTREPMDEKALPCPFCCGEPEDELDSSPAMFAPVTLWRVGCDECSAYGPFAESEALAIAAWNRRALPPSRPAEPMDELPTRHTPDKGTVQVCPTCQGDGTFVALDGNCPARWAHRYLNAAPLPSGEPTSEAVEWTCVEHGTGRVKCCDDARQVRDDYAEIANPVVDHSTPLRPDWRTDAKVHEAIVRILRKRATGDLAQKLMNEDPFTSLEELYAVCDAVAEVYAHPAAPSPAVGQGEPTFAEVAAAIGNIVGPTQSGVTFHDATPDWSVVAEHDGEVIARGEDVPAMFRALVADDKTMQAAIKAALKASPRFPLAGEHNA